MAAGEHEDVIVVDGLQKAYGEFHAIKGTSFRVHRGEIFGLLGTNGAGKTTTIEILEGYRPRNGGDVAVLGVDPARADRGWRNRIGLVLQESELDPMHTVRETVGMFARYYRKPRGVDETIDLVGLSEKRTERIGGLSGGQRRRVDVALGIVGTPELLFLDEPTTGFDPRARRDFWSMLESLRETGTTMVLTTHYMDEAQHLADRAAIMKAGEIVAEGSLDELTEGLGGTVIRFTAPAGVELADISVAAGLDARVAGSDVELTATDAQAVLTRLLGWAAERSIVLADLQAVRPTLDDVFMDISDSPGDEGSNP
jgi:ABC-2 type transport system ATP-binding protein